VQVIYLEPIVNSSLRLNENVERILQNYANAGHLVKAKYTRLLSHLQVIPGCWDCSEGTASREGMRELRRLQDWPAGRFFLTSCTAMQRLNCFIFYCTCSSKRHCRLLK